MAMRTEEYDFESKRLFRYQLTKIIRGHAPKFDAAIFAWWKQVYQTALIECPVQTGALRASIRLQRGENNTRTYNVARGLQHAISEWYILAGGGGVINPLHKREVDYAQAVHDGGPHNRPNPFLNRSMEKNLPNFDAQIEKYMKWIEKTWVENQVYPKSVWKLPIRLVPPWSGQVY